MNFKGADEYIIMAQDKLGKQIMINELSALLDASKGMYRNIITPRPEPSTLFNILNLFDTTSTLKFENNCHTYNNCEVKIYEKK